MIMILQELYNMYGKKYSITPILFRKIDYLCLLCYLLLIVALIWLINRFLFYVKQMCQYLQRPKELRNSDFIDERWAEIFFFFN